MLEKYFVLTRKIFVFTSLHRWSEFEITFPQSAGAINGSYLLVSSAGIIK